MRAQHVAGAVACSLAVACSSPSGSAPSAPSALATPNTALLAVSSISATADKVSVGAVYHLSFQLKETGGRSGATVSSILFTMPRLGGGAAFTETYTPATTQHVPASGSLDVGPITLTDHAGPSAPIAAEASVAVNFVDDGGHEGSAAGKGPITRPATYAVSGLITDGTSGPSGRMRGVLVEILDGINQGLEARTDSGGSYEFQSISPGGLTLSASIAGYESATREVDVSGDTRVDFILPPRRPGPAPTPLPGNPTPSSGLGGTWSGTGVDSMGPISVTWGLNQTGSSVSGSVSMQSLDAAGSCNSCHRTRSGSISGTFDGTTLSMTMFFPTGGADATPACSTTISGSASNVSANSLTASYSGVDSCEPPANGGTLVMTRSP